MIRQIRGMTKPANVCKSKSVKPDMPCPGTSCIGCIFRYSHYDAGGYTRYSLLGSFHQLEKSNVSDYHCQLGLMYSAILTTRVKHYDPHTPDAGDYTYRYLNLLSPSDASFTGLCDNAGCPLYLLKTFYPNDYDNLLLPFLENLDRSIRGDRTAMVIPAAETFHATFKNNLLSRPSQSGEPPHHLADTTVKQAISFVYDLIAPNLKDFINSGHP